MGIKVTVGQKYVSYRPQREKELVDKIQKGLIQLGYEVEREAKINATSFVDTGRLRSSISTNWTGSGMGKGKVQSPAKTDDGVSQPMGKDFAVQVGTNVEYAAPVEGLAPSRRPATPFLFPALESKKGKIAEFLKG